MINKLKKIVDIDVICTTEPLKGNILTVLVHDANNEYNLVAPGVDTMWLMSNQSIMIDKDSEHIDDREQFFIGIDKIVYCSRLKGEDEL